jgi:tellurite resistance protein
MTDEYVPRIPLNTFAIGFGLAGLADVWTFTGSALRLPPAIGQAFWAVAAIAWIWLVVAHATRGVRSENSLVSQLRNPVQGPIAALVPIVGMLISADVYPFAPTVARVLVILFIAAGGLFAAWLISTWMSGALPVEWIHGGYFLPTVAGGFIAATAAAETRMDVLAIGAFGVGVFFWLVMSTVILARLMFRPELPGPLVPTMAIFIAPPAVAGTAWFLVHPTAGEVEYELAGLTVVMLLVQLALVPRYRKLTFSLGFWSFTFPFAAVGGYGIQWLTRLRPIGWQFLVIAITAGITALVFAIAVKSVRLYQRDKRSPAVAPPAAVTSVPTIHEKVKVN